MTPAAALVAALLAQAAPGDLATRTDWRAAGTNALLGERAPFAHMWDSGGLHRTRTQIDLAQSRWGEILARRTLTPSEGAARVDYARDRTCVGLALVARRVEDLEPPRIEPPPAPGAHEPVPLPQTDGGEVRVWGGNSGRHGPAGEVLIDDGVGRAPSAWAAWLVRVTAACWRPDAPTPP